MAVNAPGGAAKCRFVFPPGPKFPTRASGPILIGNIYRGKDARLDLPFVSAWLCTPLSKPLSDIAPRKAVNGAGLKTYAALDLGTNNCRLLVARRLPSAPAAAPFRVIDAFSRIVRLGEGLATSGVLSEAAMARTLDALKICAEKISFHHVAGARAIVTEACRRAANCAEFMARVESETGIELEIISAEEEARLVVTGCAPLLDPRVPYALVFDIGGGSTELVWLRVPGAGAPEILGSLSLPHGVVTLSDRYGGREVSAATYEAMVDEIAAAIRAVEERHRIADRIAAGEVQMLGSSGTVTTLAAVHLDLPRYSRRRIDGVVVRFDDLRRATRLLAERSHAERARHPCIGTERADLVIAGCAILEAICRLWPVGRLRVADRGIREGILHGLVGEA
jgi:exopolyphosphatase / guanosine-5'-triphosphate,3'-diphosphate pyrophosphatase